jgi:PAS domain S-box-containing protein
MSNPGLKSRRVTSIVGCYSLALLSVATATALTFPLQAFDVRVSLFFPAVLLATWFGGTGPGLFAVLLSTLSINFFFTKPPLQFQFGVQDIPNLVAFLFAALLISSWSTARKRAEKRLRESQDELRKARDELENKVIERTAELSGSNEQFRNLVNTIDGIVWEADAQTFRFIFVGEQAERILGYPVKQWLREPTFWKDHLHPEDRDWAVQFCVNATTEKRAHDFEYRMIAADGRIVWVRDLVTVVVEDGHPTRLRGVMVDTTNRKRAEEAVRQSEKQLRDLVEAMPAMAFVSRPDGTNEFVSRGWIEFSGLSAEQTSGSGWEAPLHPDDREQHLAKWRASLASGEPFENEARHRDAQGNYRWLLVRAVPLRDEHGNVLKWYGAVTDIEDRKRAEALLAGEKRILEMVAKGDPLSQILETLCRLVEKQATDVLASILLLDGNRLRHGGAPTLPKAYTDAIDGAVIGPRVGSCGTAAFTGKQVIVTDIATDPLWKDFRAAALPHSLRACWSTPIFSSQGKVIATFAMYYREPRSPNVRDQEIIEQITHLARIAIEQKLIEDKLSQSEAYLTEAQQLAHTGSWAFDAAGFDYWSPELFRIYGLEPASTAPTVEEYLDCVHPEDREFMANLIKRILADASPFDATKRIVRPDGDVRYIRCVGAPVIENQKLKRYVGSALDVTEHELLTQELQRREAYLTEAQQLTHTGSFVWDLKTKQALYLSDEWYRVFGFEPGDERAWNERGRHIHPEDRSIWRAALDRAVEKKTEYEIDYRLLLPDGVTKYVHAVGHPVSNSSGDVVHFMGSVTDITERKRAEQALRRSEAYLADAQRLSQTGSWAWSYKSERATYWSEENFRIWGLDPQEGLPDQQTALQRVHPDDRASVFKETDTAIREKSDHVAYFRIVLPDGTVKHLESIGHPVFGPNGEKLELIGTHVDVTERKRAEALLTGEKRLLEMIATGVALKEILNALCQIIEDQRSGTLASVLLQNADGVHLNVVAAPNLPDDWIEQMEKLPIGPCAGSCGTAAFRGSPVIVSDIATDPLWNVPQHRAAALQHGLRASWSNPVVSSNGKVLGTFCIYHREPRSPNAQDFELIELATHIARVAIERDRAEEALRASEQVVRGQVEALIYSLDVLATAPAPDKFIGQMLSTIGRLLNAQGVTLWLFDESMDSLVLRLMTDGGKLVAPDSDHPFMKDRLFWKKNPAIQELLFTSGPVICEDIETDPRVYGEWREYLKRKGAKRFLAVPLLVGGQVRGFVGIRHPDRAAYRPEEIELTQALAHQVMLAIQLNEFAEQGQRAAVFEERNRMARDIHDTLAQGFTGVIVQLEAAEDAILCGCRKEVNDHLHRASELARRSLSEARRSVHALRPQALREHNFWDALKGTIKNTTAGTPLHTTFQAQGKIPRLPPAWQENLLRIGQEALTNTLKYAHARKFETRLSYKPKELRLELCDDGDGFKMKERHDGVGLTGMRERVEQMGGELKISSSHGKGTKITVVLPFNGESTT